MQARTQVSYAAFYSAIFIMLGVQLPFFSGWLALRGLSAAHIGLITGTALGARLAFGPPVAYWADHQTDDRRALRIVSLIFALSASLLLLPLGNFAIAGATILMLWAYGVIVPLVDTAVLRADRAGRANFGQARAFGSFVFLATNIIGGAVLSAFGLIRAVEIMAGAAIAAFIVSLALPAAERARTGAAELSLGDARRLLSSPVFRLTLVAYGLTQGAHAFYYAFSILDWTRRGYSPALIGVLWAIGVAAEILLLTRMRGLARRFRADVLLAIGAAGAATRWSAMAFAPPVALLAVIQVLHALTFAMSYIGGLEFVDRAAPKGLTTTAMTLNSTLGVGAVTGLAIVASGYLYQWGGACAGYSLMAVMGVCGLGAALLLRRRWDGGALFAAGAHSEKWEPVFGKMRDKTKTRSSPD